MPTMTHCQLIRSALARHESGENLQIPLPNGTTVSWNPDTAYAVAGHISQHYPWGSDKTLTIEFGHPGAGHAILRVDDDHTPAYRLIAGTNPENHLPYVRELCGHIGCMRSAPAGPGSRCATHITDPVPTREAPTYWGQLAAIAWARAHNPQDGDGMAVARRVRDDVVFGGLKCGLTKNALHKLTGIARTTIDRMIDPPPAPDDAA